MFSQIPSSSCTVDGAVSFDPASAQHPQRTEVREEREHCPDWNWQTSQVPGSNTLNYPQVDPSEITGYNAALNDSGISSWPTLP